MCVSIHIYYSIYLSIDVSACLSIQLYVECSNEKFSGLRAQIPLDAISATNIENVGVSEYALLKRPTKTHHETSAALSAKA